MTQVVGPDTVLSEWDTTLTIRGREYRLYRVGEEFWVEMEDPQFGEWGRDIYGDFLRSENETERVQKRAVLATGAHHQQVYRFSAGQGRTLFLLPFIWLVAEKRWIPYEDSFLRPHYQVETTEVWNEDCVRCHSTGSRPHFLDSGLKTDTRVGEFGISCEACHGPAEEHIRVNRDPWRRYLLNLTDQGDSAQRAIAAWHMGWKPAVEASGSEWMAPFLAEVLVGAKRQIQARWRRMHPVETFRARSELFFDPQGEVDVGAGPRRAPPAHPEASPHLRVNRPRFNETSGQSTRYRKHD